MKINLIYFTSTGNTRWVLDRIIGCFNEAGHKTAVIDSVGCKIAVSIECDLLGLVFPVWGSSAPEPILQFIANLPDGGGKKVFILGNAGMDAWDTGIHLSKKLKPKGYEVVYTGNVILPMNSSFPGLQFIKKRAPQKSALMFEYAENTIKRASKMILSGKKYFECRGIANKIGGTAIRMVYKPFVRSFKRRYFVDPEKCNGCGICSSICPKEAITITERKASIDTEQCIFCLKCYNYCPQVAVLKGKKSADIVKYPRYKGLEGYDKPLKYR